MPCRLCVYSLLGLVCGAAACGAGASSRPFDAALELGPDSEGTDDGVLAEGDRPMVLDAAFVDRGDGPVADSTSMNEAGIPDVPLDDATPVDTAVDTSPSCPPGSCDDGEPCTVDSQDESCRCRHDVLSDSSPCDDGNICTSDDRCLAGKCVGKTRSSTPAIVSTLRTFGDGIGLDTVVAFPSDARAVFLSDSTLTLLKISAGGMEVLDRFQWGSRVSSSQISATVWVNRPSTFILPLSSTRIAVIGSDWSIDLFDIGSDVFKPSYRFGFGAGSQHMVDAAAAQKDAIWTCTGNWIQRYAVDDVQGALKQNPGFTLPATHNCYGLALPAGTTLLLAATSQGLDIVDISKNDGTGTLEQTVLAGDFLVDVQAQAGSIGVYKLDGLLGGIGTISILDSSSYSVLQHYGSAGVIYPVGFAMLPAGPVVERWNETGCRAVEATTYSLAVGKLTPADTWTPFAACRSSFGLPPAVMASGGQLLDLPPAHQVVRVASASGRLSPVPARAQGSLAKVLATGTGAVEVHSATSMHAVDVTDPKAPIIREGGLLLPMRSERLSVAITTSGVATFLSVLDGELSRRGPRLSLFWQSQSGLPVLAGSLRADDTATAWTAAGTFIYGASTTGASNVRVRRFSTARLTRAEDQSPTADIDAVLATLDSTTSDSRLVASLAADAVTGMVAVVEKRTAGELSAWVVTGYAWTGTGYGPSFTRRFDSAVLDMALYRDTVALVFSDSVALVDRTGHTTATYSSKGQAQQVLSFGADRLYVAVTEPDATSVASPAVLVLGADTLSLEGRYALPQPVLSVAEVGASVVFGMSSTLAVATPACPAGP